MCDALAQRYFTFSGNVKDSLGQVIVGANIRLRNDNLGTSSDGNGYFKLKLEEGYYEMIVSAIGYQNESINLPLRQNIFLEIVLKEKQVILKGFEITNKRHDPAWEYIQNVIDNRNKLNLGLYNYKCAAYIKASDILVVDSAALKRKNKKKKSAPMNIDSVEADLSKNHINIPNMNFAEIDLVKYWGKPFKIKEERSGVRLMGNKEALYFLSITDGEFDFYKNQVIMQGLSEVKYVSPFSPGANVSYRFKLLESYYEGNRKVYRIKVTPRKMGNALFSGVTEVYDSLWIIKSVDFAINPNHIPSYVSFNIFQSFEFSNQGYTLLKDQVFTYTKKAPLGKREGKTKVHYTNYEPNLNLASNFFGNEISSVFDSAYDRKADWWDKQRKDTLSVTEQIFTHYRDSMYEIRNSKKYLDSIDKVYNKITFLKVLWWGQGFINRDKKLRMEYAPLVSMIQPGSIGGFRVGYFMQYSRQFKNRRSIVAAPYINYGFLNRDLKGSMYFSNLYDPIKRARYYLYAAREFQMINPNEAFVNMFRRSNFFDQYRIQVGHVFEVINGLYLSKYLTYSDRRDIGNYKFAKIGDEIFKRDNSPVFFDPHKSTELKLILSYTPKQLYIREPQEKIILGSKYPTFTVIYNAGIKGWLKSNVDFSYIQSSISQTVNYGRIGLAKYSISTGKFFNMNYLPIVDYKYQRRGDPFLLTNPLGTYQLLPQTFPTFNWYLEAHYWHSFNGFLTSAVPIFKRLNINASGGSSMLWAFEKNIRHVEICYGLNKVIKMLRETFKFGIYYCNGVNNVGGYYQGFKISIEQYNVRDNSWSF